MLTFGHQLRSSASKTVRKQARWVVAGTLLALAGAALAAPPAWRQGGKTASNTFFNPEEVKITQANIRALNPVWERALGAFYVGPAVQENNVLFMCSNLFGISALDVSTGLSIWDRGNLQGGNCQSPAMDGTGLVVTKPRNSNSESSYVFKLNKADGSTLWQGVSEGYTQGFNEPVISRGRVFVTDTYSGVYAFDAADGRTLWKADTGVYNNSAASADGRVFVTTWQDAYGPRQVWAFDATTGTKLWGTEIDLDNMQYPAAIWRNLVVVGSDSGKLTALNAATGAVRWSMQLSTGYISSHLAVGRDVGIAVSGSTVTAIEMATGAVRWSTQVRGSVGSNPVIANGMVIGVRNVFGTQELAALDLRTGALVNRAQRMTLPGSYARLIVVDGRVVATTNQGVIQVLAP